MCHLCNTKPVYEFTNKRKLCSSCFIRWFEKKFFYINRKFSLINRNDVISIQEDNSYQYVVLKHLLENFKDKLIIKINTENKIKLPNLLFSVSQTPNKPYTKVHGKTQRVYDKKNADKIAVSDTIDSESDKILHILIKEKLDNLKKIFPIVKEKNKITIKPLYSFLDEEVLLYAKLKNLKFKKEKTKSDNLSQFLENMKSKHPEIKRAVVNSYLKLYSKQ